MTVDTLENHQYFETTQSTLLEKLIIILFFKTTLENAI